MEEPNPNKPAVSTLRPASSEVATLDDRSAESGGSDRSCTTERTRPMPAASPHPLGAQFHPPLLIPPTLPAVVVEEGVSMDMTPDMMAAELAPGEELAELASGDEEELAELAPGDEEELAELGEAATQPTRENERVTVITPTYSMTLINDVHMYIAGTQSDEEEYQSDELERFPDAIDLTST